MPSGSGKQTLLEGAGFTKEFALAWTQYVFDTLAAGGYREICSLVYSQHCRSRP